MTTITLEFYGDKQIDRTIKRVLDNLEDATPAWEAMADRFGALETEQFASQGASGSGGWAPLAAATVAAKGHDTILVDTGALRDQLTNRPFGVENIAKDSMEVGSNLPYGGYHQNGTDRMPQRRAVEFTETDRRDLTKILQRYLITGSTA